MLINWPSVKLYNSELDNYFPASLLTSEGLTAKYDVTVTLPSNYRPSPYLDSEDTVYEFDIFVNDIMSSEKAYVTVKGEGAEYDMEWVVSKFDPDKPIVPHTGGTITFNIVINGLPTGGGLEPSEQASVTAKIGEDEFIIHGISEATVNVVYPIGEGRTDFFTAVLPESGQVIKQITSGYVLKEGDEIRVTQIELGKGGSPEYIYLVKEEEDIPGPEPISWMLTATISGSETVAMVDRQLKLADMEGYDGTQVIDEAQWEETDPAKLETRLFAKYAGYPWTEAEFDAIVGLGSSKPNVIHVWGFYEDYIYFSGSNGTGAPIQLKLIRGGGSPE